MNKVDDISGARIRKLARTGKIVLADQTKIHKFDAEFIDEFLDTVFGVTGALVTDESRLSDFISFGADPHEVAAALATIQLEYGIAVDIHDCLFDVLQRIA